MKRLLLILAFCLTASIPSFAVESVWRSSDTNTQDSNQMLCNKRGHLFSVVVSSALAGDLSFYNSSFTVTGVKAVGPIMTSSLGQYEYRTVFPAGLLYNKQGLANVTILYECY